MHNILRGCESFNQSLIMWYEILLENFLPYDAERCNATFYKLNNLIEKPNSGLQYNKIVDEILNTASINIIVIHKDKFLIPKYKDIFKHYKMPYKVVNYDVLYTLEHFGIKMIDAIDINRFTDDIFYNLFIDNKTSIAEYLIKHIKSTNKERYDKLKETLSKIFSEKNKKETTVDIYCDNVIVATD